MIGSCPVASCASCSDPTVTLPVTQARSRGRCNEYGESWADFRPIDTVDRISNQGNDVTGLREPGFESPRGFDTLRNPVITVGFDFSGSVRLAS